MSENEVLSYAAAETPARKVIFLSLL